MASAKQIAARKKFAAMAKAKAKKSPKGKGKVKARKTAFLKRIGKSKAKKK